MFNCIEGVENKIFHGINLKYYSNKLEDLKIFEEIIKYSDWKTLAHTFKNHILAKTTS